ncbi:MAG: FtsX-like permease family protein [Fulvivirga sp.]
MLKNYFKIAIRNITRNKVYSIINILGLTLGITCSSLLFLLVIDELSFDNMYSKRDQIYRVVEIDESAKETRYFGMTAPPLGEALKTDYAGIENYTRLFKFGGHINFQQGETRYHERDYFFADQNVFEVFDFEWIAGDPETALKEPYSLVIDEEWAKILFDDEDPIGKEVDSGGEIMNVVTGVIKKLPQNSHLQAKIFVSIPNTEEWFPEFDKNWRTYGAYTYMVLGEETDPAEISNKIPEFTAKYFDAEQERNFYLQPLKDVHFKSQDIEFASDTGRGQIAYVYIFIAIGCFMLIIACINYMNLATAKSLHRGKEIGIRKASGAIRGQLITQFLSESTVIALIALAISIGLVDLLIPYFNELTGKAFEFNVETFGSIFTLLFALTIVVGLLAGTYPAILMSKLRPANILKGDMSTGIGSVLLRKILVITQFSLSIIMIIATIIASNQLNYIQNASLGFNNEQMMVVDINSGNVRSRFETMRTEFAKSPYVSQVAVSSRVPGEWKNLREIYIKNMGSQDSLRTNFMGFDEFMLDLYEMELAAGENFSGTTKADSLHILVNETFVESMGLENPVGKFVEISDRSTGQYQIIGVVKDFNFQSLHNKIAPIVLGFQSNAYQSIDYFSLKFDPAHTDEVVKHASEVHNTFDTGSPIEYHFLSEQWALFYEKDRQASNVFAIGAGITIFIACLGLFGLASFIIQKRTKEIGVRKVLGASGSNLFVMLSKTFTLQILIAFCIASPLSYYFMTLWLDNFAYKMSIGLQHFVIAGVSAFGVALLTISYRLIKATQLNPADTLKTE